jgi:hypothetical protein
MAYYAVCTKCEFLRVLSERGRRAALPDACPACGGNLIYQHDRSRFEPTYVSRVSRALHSAPPLRAS